VKAVAGSIAGQVTDSRTQRALVGAQVYIPGTGLGTLTNSAGRYVMTGVPPGSVRVRVELIGYATAEQTLTVREGQATAANFQLAETALALDEIIVTGTPGGAQKRAIGNSVSTSAASAARR
jgi:hypothetical protein